MDTDVRQQIGWLDWLRLWGAQQGGYVPEREARFTAMFDALAALMPASFVALDLACGPGSISQRLLARFPRARAIAVDIDPVMLALGQGALGTVDGRLRWIDADLASHDPPRARRCRERRQRALSFAQRAGTVIRPSLYSQTRSRAVLIAGSTVSASSASRAISRNRAAP